MPPCCSYLDLPKHVTRNVNRFLLRAHNLTVESFLGRGGNGHCDKCSRAAVHNVVHVLVHCKGFVCVLSQTELPFFQIFPPNLPVLFCGVPFACLGKKKKSTQATRRSLRQLTIRGHICPKCREPPPPIIGGPWWKDNCGDLEGGWQPPPPDQGLPCVLWLFFWLPFSIAQALQLHLRHYGLLLDSEDQQQIHWPNDLAGGLI